jgi:hypothetical protein
LIFEAVTAFFLILPVVIELPWISFEPIFLVLGGAAAEDEEDGNRRHHVCVRDALADLLH